MQVKATLLQIKELKNQKKNGSRNLHPMNFGSHGKKEQSVPLQGNIVKLMNLAYMPAVAAAPRYLIPARSLNRAPGGRVLLNR